MAYSTTSVTNSQPLPGWDCLYLPPTDVKCEIGGPYYLAYGALSIDELEGMTAETTIHVTCTGSGATVRIKAVGDAGADVKLRMDGSLYGSLLVNGQTGSTGAILNAAGGLSFVNLMSKLKTSGSVAEGEFSGTGIITLDYL
ncbi:MrpH family fimbial adhesin [Serratia sp. C2(1)]|uniref:MrpH family fimbial adhesin n=1 Tax=Serratia sp. C2(1) TaxID=3117679 RepID=UPI002ED424AC